MSTKIIFVYNAKGDVFSKLTDFAHKALSPRTYNCHLCKLTYGLLTMKDEWVQFIEGLPFQAEFSYIDDWPYHAISHTYPLFALSTAKGVHVLADAKEIDQLLSLQQLKELVLSRTSSWTAMDK